MDPGNPADWIALNWLPELGPVGLRRALDRCGDVAEVAYRMPAAALRELGRQSALGAGQLAAARRGLRRRSERELARCRKLGIRPIPWPDPDYPVALREIAAPPLLVYLKGKLPHRAPRVAVVGSRTPTPYGRRSGGRAGLGAGGARDRGRLRRRARGRYAGPPGRPGGGGADGRGPGFRPSAPLSGGECGPFRKDRRTRSAAQRVRAGAGPKRPPTSPAGTA